MFFVEIPELLQKQVFTKQSDKNSLTSSPLVDPGNPVGGGLADSDKVPSTLSHFSKGTNFQRLGQQQIWLQILGHLGRDNTAVAGPGNWPWNACASPDSPARKKQMSDSLPRESLNCSHSRTTDTPTSRVWSPVSCVSRRVPFGIALWQTRMKRSGRVAEMRGEKSNMDGGMGMRKILSRRLSNVGQSALSVPIVLWAAVSMGIVIRAQREPELGVQATTGSTSLILCNTVRPRGGQRNILVNKNKPEIKT